MPMKVRYTVANGEIIAEKRNGVRRTYVPDPLGSTVALLDSNQQKTDTFSYWPYGEVKTRTGNTPTPFQYVGTLGYYRDSTGRTYVRARHYQQRYGRWMTTDKKCPITQEYAYTSQNPVNLIDFTGNSPQFVTSDWVKNKTREYFTKCFNLTFNLPSSLKMLEQYYKLIIEAYSCIFDCLVRAESSYNKTAEGKGVNAPALGLGQLSLTQFNNCTSEECQGKWSDPDCNMLAVFNLFIELCNNKPKHPHIGSFLHIYDIPPDPLDALRGNWGCARSEGNVFWPCIEKCGLDEWKIRKLPCPPRTPDCPGCSITYRVIRVRFF
jgi:RHS repeat-associated protein